MIWEVASKGRFERLIVVFTTLIAIAAWFLISEGLITPETFENEEMSSNTQGNLFVAVFFFCLVGIPTIFAVLPRLLGSKIPQRVKVDSDQKMLTLAYGKRRIRQIDFDDLAFAFIEKYSHNSLVLYHSYNGTRGQLVTNRLTELLGLRLTFSWKKKQLREIRDELLKLGIERVEDESRNLPLWEKMISK